MSLEHEPQDTAKPAHHQKQKETSPAATPLDGAWKPKGPGDSITPILHGLDTHLERTLSVLDVETDTPAHRQAVVDAASRELADASKILGALFDGVPRNQWPLYRDAVDRVAAKINRLVRFVRTRTPHKALEDSVMGAVGEFDHVLQKLGAAPIEGRPAAVLSERAQHAGERESSTVGAAGQEVHGALSRMGNRRRAAVDAFHHLASLRDNEQPPFVEQLLKSLFWALLDKMTAGFIDIVVSDAAFKGTEDSPLKTVLSKMLTTTAGTGLKSAEKRDDSKVDPKEKALAYFSSNLAVALDDQFLGYHMQLDASLRDSALTEADLLTMAATLKATEERVFQQQLVEVTKAWSTYLAHSHLGSHHAGSKKVSDMRDYFGKANDTGRAFGTDKSGGDGVLSILFVVDESGSAPRLERSATHVVGMNSLLTGLMLQDANHAFGQVALPKEVNVQCRFIRATIALDESNRIRDVRNWDALEPHVGETAHQFWMHWGKNLQLT